MTDFLNMGGYGSYVWSSFGLTLLVLVWNWFDANRRFASARKSARARLNADKGGNS